eukprot:TRINITY_DN2442_c0_g1_i11.p4 TRINITY_DN2442_c0_g1~~TRINITY_DN2442_c0_g1_i11.p4  ORF type:complete len:105 (-),score=26.10 TRINITY_DN2442_c0_g1_i11:33-347(-)
MCIRDRYNVVPRNANRTNSRISATFKKFMQNSKKAFEELCDKLESWANQEELKMKKLTELFGDDQKEQLKYFIKCNPNVGVSVLASVYVGQLEKENQKLVQNVA